MWGSVRQRGGCCDNGHLCCSRPQFTERRLSPPRWKGSFVNTNPALWYHQQQLKVKFVHSESVGWCCRSVKGSPAAPPQSNSTTAQRRVTWLQSNVPQAHQQVKPTQLASKSLSSFRSLQKKLSSNLEPNHMDSSGQRETMWQVCEKHLKLVNRDSGMGPTQLNAGASITTFI